MIKINLFFCACLWLLALGGGFYQLLLFESKPGDAELPPMSWPLDSALPNQELHPRLVLIAHPHCACSRASIGELAIIMAKFQGQVDATVLFYSPSDQDQSWTRTDIWESAQSIPGVQVIADKDGAIAQQFNAKTSGEALLYDQNGQMVFWGGITSSRGHSGDNAGRKSIIEALSAEKPEYTHTDIFGCHLFGKQTLGI